MQDNINTKGMMSIVRDRADIGKTGPTMRLLHVVTDMNPAQGGVCHSVRTMIGGLMELGIYNEVVCVDEIDAPWLKKDPFVINNLGLSKGAWFYHPRYIPWLEKNMHRFDVVIVHGLWLYTGYAARKAWKKVKSRIIKEEGENAKVPKLFVMPHGMLDPYFQQASGRKIKAIRNWLYWKLIESKMANQSNGILFTSDEEKLLAAKPFSPYHPAAEPVVGLGAEAPPAFKESMKKLFMEKCGGVAGQPYLLFLSRIHEKKGVDFLIEAYKTVTARAAISGEQLPKLVIAGPGLETGYGQQIKKLVDESAEIKASVFFPGMLNGDSKWGAFYGCEAFILPSHQENFGYAVVEALACGKPVLISNQVNIWRTISAAGGGLVENDTKEGTLALLNRWEELTAGEKKTMAARARECFEKQFAAGPAAKKMLAAISR
jgi:glycosyltransferase involved in cell wall biosynthesis